MTLRNSSGSSRVAGYGGADAGVVDEHVDAAERLHRGVDERLAVLGLGDVGGDGDRLPARLLDELLRLLQLLDPPGAERHVRARLGERLGERHAEPRRGPRHDRDLAVQLEPVEYAHARTICCSPWEPHLGWGALAASSLVIGALLGVARPWPNTLVGAVLAFGAGALISAVSFDLVEEGSQIGDPGYVGLGLAAGALTYFGLDHVIDRPGS